MAKQGEEYDLLLSGGVDIINITPGHYPGRFLLCDAYNLPYFIPYFGEEEATTGKKLRETLYEEFFIPHHFSDVKTLWTGRFEPNVLHSASKPVRTIEDIKGMTVSIPGGNILANFVKGLGGSPEFVAMTDVYTSLERGVVDATILPLETQLSFKFYEVTKAITKYGYGAVTNSQAMNLGLWNSLPPDIQNVFNELSAWATVVQTQVSQGSTQAAIGVAKKNGLEIIDLSPEELGRWKKVAEPLEMGWVADVDSKGLPGTELYNRIQELISK